MIYTNNIEQTAKELEQKLNECEDINSNVVKVFTVSTNGQCLDIDVYWTLSLRELNKIAEILDSTFYVTSAPNGYNFRIWVATENQKEGE